MAWRVMGDMAYPILTYHQIAPPAPVGTPYRHLNVAPDLFAKQMLWLKRMGYQGLSMSALMPYLQGRKKGRVVGITLDDGYLDNLTHALPVLKAMGFSATCYVVSQLVGQTNVWDQSQGMAEAPLMNAAQLRTWVAQGQEVGAHSRHHHDLQALSASEALQEIALCKTEIEQITGQAVEHFCYPYGEYGPKHITMVRQSGYASAITTQRGRAAVGDSLFELKRVPMFMDTHRYQLWLKLATPFEDHRHDLRDLLLNAPLRA